MKVFWWNNGERVYRDLVGKFDIVAHAGVSFIIARNPLFPKVWGLFEFTTGALLKSNMKTKKDARAFAEMNVHRTIEALKRSNLPDVNSPNPVSVEVAP